MNCSEVYIITKKFKITGMHCCHCETTIENILKNEKGILSVKASYQKEILEISFDEKTIDKEEIKLILLEIGYDIDFSAQITNENCSHYKKSVVKFIKSFAGLIIIFSIIFLARYFGHKLNLPEMNTETSMSLIFIFGLLTSVHCVGMCGNFIIGNIDNNASKKISIFKSNLLYALGKTLSYTIFGALFGFLGQLFKITPLIGGTTITIAGIFLILYGLHVLNIFSFVKTLNIQYPKSFLNFINNKNIFWIGFLSGLLFGCGPLQAMYALAAVNGSVFGGAKILLIFNLGTLPLLLGFNYITKFLSTIMTRNFIKISGIILIIMGFMMLNKGISQAKQVKDSKVKTHKCHGGN